MFLAILDVHSDASGGCFGAALSFAAGAMNHFEMNNLHPRILQRSGHGNSRA
jgi:hypothetical protein